MRSPTLYCILLASACLACRHAAKQPSAAPDSTVSTRAFTYPQARPIVLGYNRFLSQLDTDNLTNSQVARHRFQKDFTGQSAQVCDTGFMLFWALQQRLNCNTPEKYIGPANLDSLADAEFNGKRLSPRQQKIYQVLLDNHFIVAEDEGNNFLTPGWRLINAHFSPYLSDPMQEALAQNVREEKEGFQDDAAFSISPRQLASRTVWWENFITKYPRQIYLEDAKSHYDMLLYLLVKGMDNAPVIRDDSLITPFTIPSICISEIPFLTPAPTR